MQASRFGMQNIFVPSRRLGSTIGSNLRPAKQLEENSLSKLSALQNFIQSDLILWESEAIAAAAATPDNITPPNVLRSLRRKVARRSNELGFFRMTQPLEFGGNPATDLELVAFREAIAAANLPKLGSAVFGPGAGILAHATGRLRDLYLEPVLRGEMQWSFGFTEPANATERTRAVHEGDMLVVDGVKSYVTGGDTADFVAALCTLMAENGAKNLGSALVVIPTNAPGVHIERVFRSLDLDTAGHAYMRFSGVRVPSWSVIGRKGGSGGMESAMRQIGNVRLSLSAEAVGMAAWALSYARDRLNEPHRSGTPLAQKEHIRLRFGDLWSQTLAARSMLYHTAKLLEDGEAVSPLIVLYLDSLIENDSIKRPCSILYNTSIGTFELLEQELNSTAHLLKVYARLQLSPQARSELSATKVFCSETAGCVVDGVVQLCGGTSIVIGSPLEAAYKRVRQWRFAEGESDSLMLKVAEHALTGVARL